MKERDRARRDEGVAVKSRCACQPSCLLTTFAHPPLEHSGPFSRAVLLDFLDVLDQTGSAGRQTLAEKFTPDRRSETRCRLLCWACTDVQGVCIAREERSHLISKCAQPSCDCLTRPASPSIRAMFTAKPMYTMRSHDLEHSYAVTASSQDDSAGCIA